MTSKTEQGVREPTDLDRRIPARSAWRGDHPEGVTPPDHLWLPDRIGVPGSRICKWCCLTQRPDEIALYERSKSDA
jgi:hypothetical protein